MSKATKNAHDWHCEEHNTFGWRGESCKQCPTALSEIESLRQQLAKKDTEIARLKTVPMKYRRMAFNAQLQDENEELRQQLADMKERK